MTPRIRVCSRRFGYFLLALDVDEDRKCAFTTFTMTSSEVFGTREEAEAAKAHREGRPFVAHQWKRNPRADQLKEVTHEQLA